ncbi:MAG: hypothetical protein ACLQJR_30300 [Stellaceae bacterium]
MAPTALFGRAGSAGALHSILVLSAIPASDASPEAAVLTALTGDRYAPSKTKQGEVAR